MRLQSYMMLLLIRFIDISIFVRIRKIRLICITHNVVVDHYRTNKDNVELSYDIVDEDRESNPLKLTEQSLSSDILMRAVAKLNKRYQQIIVLKYINELDNKEVAKIMNKSEGSLRILKFRALKALRNILNDMNIPY